MKKLTAKIEIALDVEGKIPDDINSQIYRDLVKSIGDIVLPLGSKKEYQIYFLDWTVVIRDRKELIMQKMNVFATKEELADLRNLAIVGWMPGGTPMISSALEEITKDQKTIDVKKACHMLALSHGLPEITGYYGICEDGEFVSL